MPARDPRIGDLHVRLGAASDDTDVLSEPDLLTGDVEPGVGKVRIWGDLSWLGFAQHAEETGFEIIVAFDGDRERPDEGVSLFAGMLTYDVGEL